MRRRFENKLISNLLDTFVYHGVECFLQTDEQGRLYLTVSSRKNVNQILTRVFGLTSISEILATVNAQPATICKAVLQIAEKKFKGGEKFAIRVSRIGSHTYTSMELAAKIGKEVLTHCRDKKVCVDLKKPDIEFFVEVRHNKAYIYTERTNCIGGLPISTQGVVVASVENEDDVLAAWLMMKQGYKVVVVCDKKILSSTLMSKLRMWDVNLVIIPASREKRLAALKAAAEQYNAKGIVTSENVRKKMPVSLPVFNPFLRRDKDELTDLKNVFLKLSGK